MVYLDFYISDNEEAHDCSHMTWYHKFKILWKKLEEIISRCISITYLLYMSEL